MQRGDLEQRFRRFERRLRSHRFSDCDVHGDRRLWKQQQVSATFTIEDTTAPVFDAYTPTTVVECTDSDGDDLNYLPLTAQDDCSDVLHGGIHVHVRWLLVDHHAHLDGHRRLWKQHDGGTVPHARRHHAPEVTAPADYTVSADAMDCSADISEAAAGYPNTATTAEIPTAGVRTHDCFLRGQRLGVRAWVTTTTLKERAR